MIHQFHRTRHIGFGLRLAKLLFCHVKRTAARACTTEVGQSPWPRYWDGSTALSAHFRSRSWRFYLSKSKRCFPESYHVLHSLYPAVFRVVFLKDLIKLNNQVLVWVLVWYSWVLQKKQKINEKLFCHFVKYSPDFISPSFHFDNRISRYRRVHLKFTSWLQFWNSWYGELRSGPKIGRKKPAKEIGHMILYEFWPNKWPIFLLKHSKWTNLGDLRSFRSQKIRGLNAYPITWYIHGHFEVSLVVAYNSN